MLHHPRDEPTRSIYFYQISGHFGKCWYLQKKMLSFSILLKPKEWCPLQTNHKWVLGWFQTKIHPWIRGPWVEVPFIPRVSNPIRPTLHNYLVSHVGFPTSSESCGSVKHTAGSYWNWIDTCYNPATTTGAHIYIHLCAYTYWLNLIVVNKYASNGVLMTIFYPPPTTCHRHKHPQPIAAIPCLLLPCLSYLPLVTPPKK